MEESEIGKELFAQEELVPIVPGFLKKDHVAALTGSDRGTAYHRLLECLDYRRAYSITELMAQTEELIAEGKMTKEAAEFQIDPRFRKKSGWNADAECLFE